MKRPAPSLDLSIEQRKAEHLTLATSDEAAFKHKGTLLDQVQLIHQALPEHHLEEIDLSISLLGKSLKAPIVISGMTGGTEQAKKINQDLAKAAEVLGIGFGLGSQRAMLLHPELAPTYQVREAAPTTLVMANLGLMQAKELSTSALRQMVDSVGADALCLHLNPAMELIQAGGDRDFRGGKEAIKHIQGELGLPIVIKETGCGLSKQVGEMLRDLGICTVDVSGAGGTSWVGVETLRAQEKTLGQELWDWGIPTAVSVAWMSQLGFQVIATGGLRSGIDVAHAMALGALAGGLAAPVLKAHQQGGYEGVIAFLEHIITGIRAVTFLTGNLKATDLNQSPRILGMALRTWLEMA